MLSHAFLSGNPGNGIYAQALVAGNFFVVLQLSGEESKVNLELGRDTVSKIEEVISQTPEILPTELAKIVKSDLGEEIELSMLAAFVAGQKIILSCQGQVEAKLFRKGKIVNLTGNDLSGNLLQGDLLILATEALLSKMELREISGFEDKSPAEINDILLPRIEQEGDGPDVAGIILKLDLENEISDEQSTASESVEIAGENDKKDFSEIPPNKIESETSIVQEPKKTPEIFQKISRFLPSKNKILYLRQSNSQEFANTPPKKTLYLVVIVFVIFISFVAFQLRSRSLEVASQAATNVEKGVNEGISSASNLFGLNDSLAKETLEQKRAEIVSQIEKDFGNDWKNLKTPEGKRIILAISRLDEAIAKASHINLVSNPEIFYDFSLLKPEPEIVSAQLHDGVIIALDKKNGSVFSLGTENKSGSIVGGGDFKSNSYLDFSGDNIFVFKSPAIYKKDLTSNASFKKTVNEASDSGKISGLASFGGNVYLLDTQKNQVWKFMGTEEGSLNPPVPYIQPGVNIDLSQATGLAIDGYVYVPTGKTIWKFASGAPEELKIENLPTGIKSIGSLYASEEGKNIYLWDGENNRIVVIDKEGKYKAQYQLPIMDAKNNTIILADEKQKKIFLISGEKVYGIGMK